MTSSSPPEAPHRNGTTQPTLSPASPKPIHVPDLENIPVLQNQIDPIFNMMSTHMATQQSAQPSHESSDPHDTGNFKQPEPSPGGGDAVNGHQISQNQPSAQSNESEQDGGHWDFSTQQSSSNEVSAPLGSNESVSAHASSTVASFAQNQQQQDQASSLVAPHASEESYQSGENNRSLKSPEPLHNPARPPNKGLNIETGHIQALLDNLIASAPSTAPVENVNASVSGPSSTTAPQVSSPDDSQTPISALPTPAGLPPRPPPQDAPSIHPNYAPGQSIQSYHNPPQPTATQIPSAQTNDSYHPAQNQPAANAFGLNGLPPPPGATFQQPSTIGPNIQETSSQQQSDRAASSGAPGLPTQHEPHQPQNVADQDEAYEAFLREESKYVADGTWDRFPQGSRLFLGNLFTEKVSKRMIWDVFSEYGSLAQISMKNAYGFVQFIDPAASRQAMVAEEGTELGGRKIHLEISKPQKNTRNNANNDRARGGRRSRSPDYGRGYIHGGQRPGSNTYAPFERRGRDDYRPMRSPSPRGARGYGNRAIDRYYGGRRSRSPSPYGRPGRYRSRSPGGRGIDDEASLPIPRRKPVQVPEVQIIIIDESDRTFVGYIQQSFRDRGLRCDVLQLPRGVDLQAVVKRQIREGVQAVVKIYRKSQVTGKIPLQVFDRSGGMDNVRFDEYEELDAGVAADVVVRAKQQPPVSQYPQNQGYAQPPYQHPQPPSQHMPHQAPLQQPQAPNANPNVQNALSALDGQTLQKLLSSLNQNSPTNQTFQGSPQQGQPPQDLAALLSTVARQTPSQQQQPGGSYQQQPHTPTQGGYSSYQTQPSQQQQPVYPNPHAPPAGGANAFANNPALAQLLRSTQQAGQQYQGAQAGQQGYQGMPQQQQPPQQQHNVQDIMAQLAKYRQ